jgi:hypothetical protein
MGNIILGLGSKISQMGKEFTDQKILKGVIKESG